MVKITAARLTFVAMAFAACTSCASGSRGGGPIEGLSIVFLVKEPPRERVEEVPVSPGREYVWVKGHWSRDRDDYAWTPGHYERVPEGRREWVPGHWDHESRGWFWVEGRWA
jgi:hypothetical protein